MTPDSFADLDAAIDALLDARAQLTRVCLHYTSGPFVDEAREAFRLARLRYLRARDGLFAGVL